MSIALVLSVNECLYFQNLVGFLKDHTIRLGSMHFSYPPAEVRLEVSTMQGQAVDATAGSWDQRERELLCLFGTIS